MENVHEKNPLRLRLRGYYSGVPVQCLMFHAVSLKESRAVGECKPTELISIKHGTPQQRTHSRIHVLLQPQLVEAG